MDALVAARDTKFEVLIPALRTGTGTEGFTNARDVLVLVVTAVVLMAVRQARADVDDGEDEDWDAGGGSDAVAGGGAGAVSSDFTAPTDHNQPMRCSFARLCLLLCVLRRSPTVPTPLPALFNR